jgi:AmmeMemoRadiSam system protein B
VKTAFQNIRPPAFAGSFYPTDPEELRSTIEGYLRNVKSVNTVSPKAVIAPHAGYIYSGPIAASAFARFASARDVIRRVVLIGPGHRIPFKGLATTSADAWLTPLGAVPLDTEAIKHICALPHVRVIDDAHAGEHSLEVQLPFLQVVLGDFKIVPLVIGDASSEQVSEVAEALWGGEETRFVISSDLSHYHDYATARKLDLATARAIETLRPTDIGEEQACGRIGIRGLLRAAKRHQLRTHTLDLRNSGDTAGPRSQVVGYGAWDFVEERSVIEGRA